MNLNEDDRAIVDNYSGRLILLKKKNKLLGGSLIAENAGEIFQELILAKTSGLGIDSFFKKLSLDLQKF